MNIYLLFILAVLTCETLLDLVIEITNIKSFSPKLPAEFEGYYSEEKYATSQKYAKENSVFALFEAIFCRIILIVFILFGGFNFVDIMVRSLGLGIISTGLLFAGAVFVTSQLLKIPFSLYKIFVVEEKYGFNRMNLKTFFADFLKTLVIGSILGGIVFAAILFFFEKAGNNAWYLCWIFTAVFQIFVLFLAPVIIMPLFNKFIPLEDGELKQEIEDYAKRENFKLQGVFKMDGSKRSSKSNAYFTGFGKYRRIVLFDTLIQKHSTQELVSVLAHEMGHFKCGHILKNIVIALINMGIMFFVMSFLIKNPLLFDAFSMENISVYAGLFFFSIIYSPVNVVVSVFTNVLSRKFEYEADAYSVKTYKNPQAMIEALKQLSVHNLSNLTPHKLKVFFEYSHPPVLRRIQAIKNITI